MQLFGFILYLKRSKTSHRIYGQKKPNSETYRLEIDHNPKQS